jgi:hypothetical protein
VRTHQSADGRAVSGGDVGKTLGEMVGESWGSPSGGLPAAGWLDGGCGRR